jgi:hypothetical protein
MALPSSLTDDCLLASTWDYAGTTRHATPRRKTPTTSIQHLWRKHRSTARGTSLKRHCLNILRQPREYVSASLRLQVFHHHLRLHLPEPRVPAITPTSPQASTPSNDLRDGWCGILAQGDGLVTQTTSQAPVTSALRTKLRASRTLVTTPNSNSNSSQD